MAGRTLSIFIDESGDFGAYEEHSPYYIVSVVLHNQNIDISEDIDKLENYLSDIQERRVIHTGPLIRRESDYKDYDVARRRLLFNAIFNFTRKVNICYSSICIKKKECRDIIALTSKLSVQLSEIIREHYGYFNQFGHVVIYYDNGQIELTRLLTAVLSSMLNSVEFRPVSPSSYKLFQVADLICTMELLAQKSAAETFSNSETLFFGSARNFKKNYLKALLKKRLS